MRTRKQERASVERNGCKQEKAENTCFDDLYEQYDSLFGDKYPLDY